MEVKGCQGEREQRLERDLKSAGVVWIFSVMFFIPAFLWVFMLFPSSYIEMATGKGIYDNIYFSWVTNNLGSVLVLLYFVRAFRMDGVDLRCVTGERKIPFGKLFLYTIFFIVVKISMDITAEYFNLVEYKDHYDLDNKPFNYLFLFSAGVTFITPLYEEFIYRGVFFNKLAEWKGVRKAVIFSGVIFAFIHGFDKGVIFILSGGVFYYGYIYHKTKSLYAPIFMHFMNNLILSLLALMTDHIPDSTGDDLPKSLALGSLAVLIICYPFVIRLFRTMWRELGDERESVYMHNVRELHGHEEASVIGEG